MFTTSERTMNAAHVTQNTRTPACWLVIFGFVVGSEFIVSHSTPSRTYSTEAGANRAAARWTAK
jgi:hypothetical protein